jgi:hypothetical protein
VHVCWFVCRLLAAQYMAENLEALRAQVRQLQCEKAARDATRAITAAAAAVATIATTPPISMTASPNHNGTTHFTIRLFAWPTIIMISLT